MSSGFVYNSGSGFEAYDSGIKAGTGHCDDRDAYKAGAYSVTAWNAEVHRMLGQHSGKVRDPDKTNDFLKDSNGQYRIESLDRREYFGACCNLAMHIQAEANKRGIKDPAKIWSVQKHGIETFIQSTLIPCKPIDSGMR